jgi:hypothetical protein
MTHSNFYIFRAKNRHELGFLAGQKFAPMIGLILQRAKKDSDWEKRTAGAKALIKINREYFPALMEELEGQAKGANIDLIDLWTLLLEKEGAQTNGSDKCTTIITNNGLLIAHNEDWEESSENDICVVLKEVGDLKIFELRYYHTLGGDSISINSNGFVVAVNSLCNKDHQIGVSRNIIARWLSETKDPVADIKKLSRLPRAEGYSHNIVGPLGRIMNIEYTAKEIAATQPTAPFIHTNHYLAGSLAKFDTNDNSGGTIERHAMGVCKTKPVMTISELKYLTNDASNGTAKSIMNKKTVAKMIVDLSNFTVLVWLRTEKKKGWVSYDLKKLFGKLEYLEPIAKKS